MPTVLVELVEAALPEVGRVAAELRVPLAGCNLHLESLVLVLECMDYIVTRTLFDAYLGYRPSFHFKGLYIFKIAHYVRNIIGGLLNVQASN